MQGYYDDAMGLGITNFWNVGILECWNTGYRGILAICII
jgi:hypothetical protein